MGLQQYVPYKLMGKAFFLVTTMLCAPKPIRAGLQRIGRSKNGVCRYRLGKGWAHATCYSIGGRKAADPLSRVLLPRTGL